MATIKATLHHYQYPSGDHPEYKAMVREIEANADGRGHWMNSIHDSRNDRTKPHGTVETVEIETDHIFGNQWNTADGRRIFDWYEGIIYNNGSKGNCRFGHWLEISPELAELRRVTLACGYCGKHYGPYHEPAPANGFCDKCLDSPCLKESELHLLRLMPEAENIPNVYTCDRTERAKLTEAEAAELKPLYVERQTIGTNSRAVAKRAKQRADIEHSYQVDTANAKAEHDGMLWLLDRGFDIENVIYYNHTGKFSFGWRSPVSAGVKSKLLDVLSEFPFDYEIISEDSKPLTKVTR